MQDHAANELYVKVALAQGTLGGLTHGGEGRDEKILQICPFTKLPAEGFGARL